MSKRTECYAIFGAHSEAKRDRAIEIAMSTTGVSKTTAQTYYPAWRKEFMAKPYYVELEREMKSKIKISNEAADKSQETVLNHNKVVIKTKMDNKTTEVAEKSPIKEAGINWKVDVINPVKDIIPDVNIGEIVSNAFDKGRKQFIENSEKIIGEAKEHATQRTEKLISSVKNVIIPVETDKEKENIFEITRLVPVTMRGKHGTYNFDAAGVKATDCEELISKDKMAEALEALEIWERSYKKEGVQA